MELNYKKMVSALNAIENERKIPESVVIEALEEAMAKAYKKDAELQDINVISKVNEKKGNIDIFQIYTVVEEVMDDELEMSLEDARIIDPNVDLGGEVSRKVEINTMSRAAATLARNVMRQKIREAEKVAIYDEYINQLYDMVFGTVESVKDKFTLVNLGKAVAMMPKSQELPNEDLYEGQKIRVVITEVNKETRGSQVLVSRSDAMLVKRLFEKEVPEIADGIVEIKAIARDAGERTKMAVISHNPDVDPIGACIGPRGSRVQLIIDELHGEKVDIFEWSEDITELVKNALAPAEVIAVLPGNGEDSLIVVVDEGQLSLAIGKRGKNARLAVKLTNHKIDIKTRAELEAMGKDYDALLAQANELRKEAIEKRLENALATAVDSLDETKDELVEAAKQKVREAMEEEAQSGSIPEEMQEAVTEALVTEIAMEKAEDEVEEAEEVVETPVTEEEVVEEKEETETEDVKKDKLDLEELAERAQEDQYVSKFEKLLDNGSDNKDSRPKRRYNKRRKEEDAAPLSNKELEEKLRDKIDPELMPTYTEEELVEIKQMEEAEKASKYDIDYDEYEDFYLEEEMGK